MMSKSPLFALVAVGAMAALPARAQQFPLAYVVDNAPRPGCPGLVLHLRVDPKTISGFASYSDMKGVSRVVGTRNGVGHFDMTLEPIDPTGPKGRIVGDSTVTTDQIRAVLKGEGCNDGPLRINTLKITNGYSQQ
jgi:hypothetical protein